MALVFEKPTVCYNSSVYLESVCNNRGTCANKTDAECVCDGQYIKENYCLTTISEELNNANFPFYVTIAIVFALLIFLTLYDFIIDITLKAWPSMKRPIAVGKITLFLASIAIFIHVVIDYVEHSGNTRLYRDVRNILRFFSDFLTLMTYSIAALSWISVILKAKGLGKEMKGLTVYRRYVLVANLILLPIYFISNVLGLVFDSDLLVLVNVGVSIIVFAFYLSLIIGTSVFIWKAFVWIRSVEISRRTATTERVKLKTYFLVGANAVASLRFCFWMVSVSSGNTSTKLHLYLLILKISQGVFFLFLLLILENHIIRLPLYIRTGEIRSNTFLAASGSTRPSVTTQSMASSKRRKSTTDSTRDASSVAQTDALVASRAASLNSTVEDEEPEDPGKTEEEDAEASLRLSSSAPPSSSSSSGSSESESASGSTSGYYSTSVSDSF